MGNNKIIYLSAAATTILVIVLIILFTSKTQEIVSSNGKSADKNLLIGDWVRTDASYFKLFN